jgi:hypothetical protein
VPISNIPEHITRQRIENTPTSQMLREEMLQCPNLYIGTSKIKDAGEGLFAAIPMNAGIVLGGYWGSYLDEDQKNLLYGLENKDAKLLFMLRRTVKEKRLYLDGDACCPMTKINDIKNSGSTANVRFLEKRQRLFNDPTYLKAVLVRNVQKGEELLTNYGDLYWGYILI